MKKYIVCFFLFLVFGLFAFIWGCGQSNPVTTTTTTTTTTSTTTSTVLTAYVSAAKAGALVANGSSNLGSSAVSIGQASATVPTVQSLSVKGVKICAPPSTFFTQNLAASTTGYLTMTDVGGGNVTPSMRMYTKNGDVIKGTIISEKTLAKFGTVDVQAMISGGEGIPIPGMMEGIQSFILGVSSEVAQQKTTAQIYANTTLYDHSLTTFAEYIAWVNIWPTIEVGQAQQLQPLGVHFTNPQPTINDKIGSMECLMVFSKSATGEIAVLIGCDPSGDGKPVAGSYSGTGNLLIPNGTLEAAATLKFIPFGANDISIESVTIGGTLKPSNYTLSITMNPISGTGTGIMSSEANVTIATMEVTALGGTIYFTSGQTEPFSF